MQWYRLDLTAYGSPKSHQPPQELPSQVLVKMYPSAPLRKISTSLLTRSYTAGSDTAPGGGPPRLVQLGSHVPLFQYFKYTFRSRPISTRVRLALPRRQVRARKHCREELAKVPPATPGTAVPGVCPQISVRALHEEIGVFGNSGVGCRPTGCAHADGAGAQFPSVPTCRRPVVLPNVVIESHAIQRDPIATPGGNAGSRTSDGPPCGVAAWSRTSETLPGRPAASIPILSPDCIVCGQVHVDVVGCAGDFRRASGCTIGRIATDLLPGAPTRLGAPVSFPDGVVRTNRVNR